MASSRISGLYAISPQIADSRLLFEKVSAALLGGARIIQYRNKSASPAQQLQHCSALVPLARSRGALLIVNDSPDLAAEIGADGVHIGRDDPPIHVARARLGSNRLIGVSCYNDLARAQSAAAAGADYVAFGSFFQSTTKPGASAAPIALLRSAKSVLRVPVVAIGGINAANAAVLIEAGADAVAIVSALFSTADIEAEARRICALFTDRDQGAAVRGGNENAQ